MSRFFNASDSESESSQSDTETAPQRPVASRAFAFSDDEEETKRVVRSAKDKRYEEMRNIIRQMKNHKKIKDMAKTLTDFESLTKCYDKARKVIEKEGIPKFFIVAISDLEEFVNECWEDRDGRKAMSKNNAKGLTTLRQKLRKHNRDFEKEVADYRQNPDDGVDDDEESKEEDSDESDDDEDLMPGSGFLKEKPPAKVDTEESKSKSKFPKGDEDDDSDSEFWGSSSSDEETTTDEEEYQANPAARFLKQAGGDSKKHEKKKKEKKVQIREEDEYPSDGEKDEWQTVKQGSSTVMEKPKMFSKDTEINHLAVIKKLDEILAARGKKATDRTEQLELLRELLTISDANNLGPAMHIKIFFHIISAIYDYNPNIATCMRPEMWAKCLENLECALNMLVEQPDITVSQNISEDSESVETVPYRVRGCILTAMERMDEEFTKMLQACDAHSTEYVDRLKDEQKVCSLLERLMAYLEDRASTEEKCRVYLCYVEHVYYKFDRKYFDYKDGITEKPDGETSEQLLARLCKFIYANDVTDRLRTRAILCHIYHHALHDRWFQARDLMLMSHLQDTCHHSDVPTQILYNRTMVQLGLCAFREGMIKDAHNALVDIQSGGRAKELLAQGLLLQRQHERTPEQEKIEKRRQMPYHKHINLELLECVYLVSAMLMEIPYMAAHEFDARRRMISKNFHHVMRMSDRQTLTGPPESMRENVVAASKAMKTGNWRSCKDFIVNEKMNAKVWDLFHNKDRVRDMIATKIQEESLRTYLFTYSSVYDSLSLITLSQMFELEKAVTHSIISKMIINEELMASLDEPTQTVVMHRTEPSRLQSLALQLSEKVSSLVDNNEKIMDMKQGNFYPYQKGGQQDGYNRNQDNRNWGNRNQQNQNWGRRQNRQQQKSYY